MTDVLSLSTVATTQLAAARHARTGRAAKTIHGGHEATLRQTVLALTAGTALGEHDSPGQARQPRAGHLADHQRPGAPSRRRGAVGGLHR